MAKRIETFLTFGADSSNEYRVTLLPVSQEVRFETTDEEWQLDMTPEEAIDLADELARAACEIQKSLIDPTPKE